MTSKTKRDNESGAGLGGLALALRSCIRAIIWFFSNRVIAGLWATGVCLGGTYYYAKRLDHVYPIKTWLFWQLGSVWGWLLLLVLGCSSFGQFFIHRVLRLRDLQLLESAVLGMTCGVMSFVWVMYLCGAFALYSAAFAVLVPLGMIALSHRQGFAFARRVYAASRTPSSSSPIALLATGAGVLCVGVLYLNSMTPESLNYDSVWSHMTVAQDYARERGVVAFPGDFNKNMPQLHSMIYAWGFLVPGLEAALRWMLALHIEFILFVWTLVGTGAGIQALLGGQKVPGAWTAFFLFPAVFVYDSNLGGAADHVCAFFMPAILIAVLRLCRDFRPENGALLGIAGAGAMLTKYQAAYVIAPAAVIAVAAAVWHVWSWRRTESGAQASLRALGVLGVLVGVGGLAVCPHFVRNFVFYRNPFYPFMSEMFTKTHPTVPHFAYNLEYVFKDFTYRPQGTLYERLKYAIELCFEFSFEPHYSFTKNVPMFGSLFTLLLPLLVFVRHRGRIAIGAALAGGALFIWAFTYTVDRNLQGFMPLLGCVTGAVLIEGYRLGALARIGLLPLVGLQLVWGGDAVFYSSAGHIQSSIDLIRTGYEGTAATRLKGYRANYLAIHEALPEHAKVILHAAHGSLGIDRELLLDLPGFQGLISYEGIHTPRELFDYYRSLGITHLVYPPFIRAEPSKQEEVLWDVFTGLYTRNVGTFGDLQVMAIPDSPPPVEAPYRLAAFGLAGYPNGLYPIERMNTNQILAAARQVFPIPQRPLEPKSAELAEVLPQVDALFVGDSVELEPGAESIVQTQFRRLAHYGGEFSVYLNHQRDHEP